MSSALTAEQRLQHRAITQQLAKLEDGLQEKIRLQDDLATYYAKVDFWIGLPGKLLPFVASALLGIATSLPMYLPYPYIMGFVVAGVIVSALAGTFVILQTVLQYQRKSDNAAFKRDSLHELQCDLLQFSVTEEGKLTVTEPRFLQYYADKLYRLTHMPPGPLMLGVSYGSMTDSDG